MKRKMVCTLLAGMMVLQSGISTIGAEEMILSDSFADVEDEIVVESENDVVDSPTEESASGDCDITDDFSIDDIGIVFMEDEAEDFFDSEPESESESEYESDDRTESAVAEFDSTEEAPMLDGAETNPTPEVETDILSEVVVEEKEVTDMVPLAAQSEGSIAIDAAHFPDGSFRQYIAESFDLNGDGFLNTAEIAGVTVIEENLDSYEEIRSLSGIEYFTELKELHTMEHRISNLDLSANKKLEILDCSCSGLKQLDLSSCLNLKELYISENSISHLALGANKQLEVLDCSDNGLKELDLSSCTKLRELKIGDNYITHLDLGVNKELKLVNCDSWDGMSWTFVNRQDCSADVEYAKGEWRINIEGLVGKNNLSNVGGLTRTEMEKIYGKDQMADILGENGPGYTARLSENYVYLTFTKAPDYFIYSYNTGAGYIPVYVELNYKEEVGCATGQHSYGKYKVTKAATALKEGAKERTCTVCGVKQTEKIKKLTATIKLNVSKLTLKKKQSTSAVKVTGLAKGDSVKSWKSSNTKVVKVSKSGKITAQTKTGKATVTITLKSGKTAKIAVTVQSGAVKTTKITGLAKTLTLKKGKKKTLKPVLEPITSTEKVTYSTSNKKIAMVSSKGVITAKKAGKAKIKVKSGKKTFTVTVTVK